ncbi:hypothetical protein I6N90_11885 [Paenibacillus sp. GSMTC-2017]|uniref:SWIM zinc finger family protein n=1 Tax=Paenibacillus sp. GSMTC-2017 TaxID=2794350 RepID=UPI0018D9BD15|nr:hypothetical protein [Paenibacillus sp. GSMTC-2017]MBH5318505.1 hypothetical protein [Paenibacillus sp. GSMTC-2017]
MRLLEKLHSVLEQQLNEYISGPIIKHGWSYYKNGQVKSVTATAQNTLTGVVNGSTLYAVVIDAEHLRYSSCTCPYDGLCKHMVAIYFQYCSEHKGGPIGAEQCYFRLLGLTPARNLVKEEEVIGNAESTFTPNEGDPFGTWLEWMESEYGETWRKCRHSLHALQPLLSSLKGLSKDWEKSYQRLHWSTAIIFILEQAERAILTVDSFSRYYHEMSFLRMAEPWIEHCNTLIGELEPKEMNEREIAWSNALIFHIKQRALLTEKQLFDWSFLYLSFCEKLSENRDWYEQEMSRLLNELDSQDIVERNDSFLHNAAGMMYFFDQKDDQSIHHFVLGSFEKSQKLIYPCVAKRIESGQWDTVEKWMSFLNERVYNNRNARTVGPFITLCRRADEARPDLPIWTTYMMDMLPYSYNELSEHWLKAKRYEEWADLQLFIGVKLEDINAPELREVAKVAPHTLMPIYHQSIESAIGTRNRQGYRMAAKQLKKLEKLYKASKETAKWEGFLIELVAKNQRLRALQEELWKGKVVT